jgi:archaemetzincin
VISIKLLAMRILYLFLLSICFSCTKTDKINRNSIIALQPYKGFSSEKVDTLAKTIESFYKFKVIVLPEIDLPKSAFVSIKKPRYRADSIIKIQKRNCPDTIDYIMGLTHKDISVTKNKKPEWKYNDFGIMGLAYCPGKSAIVSSFRLKSNDAKVHFNRLKKVTIHEFGHNLGLSHCSNKHCVMTSANEKLSTIDNEEMELCKNCILKI